MSHLIQNVAHPPHQELTMRQTRNRILAAAVALAAGAAALVPAGGVSASVGAQGGGKCPLSALKKAKGPVEITFWHSTARANEETLQRLTNKFNSSQSKVRVKLVNQTSYKDTLDKYVAGLSTGDLPDIVQLEDTALQQAIDTQSFLPVQACVKADHYDMSDYVDRVVRYWTVKGTLWPMPFNVSNPVFFYDKNKFQKAGLDPENPPRTFADLRAAAEKLKSSGVVSQAPMGLKLDAWHLEQWLALADKPYVNHGNGRKSRANAVAFDVSAGVNIFTFLSGLVHDGLAVTNPNEGPSQYDNLIGIGNGDLAMSIDSSAVLGTVTQILESGQFPGVKIGIGFMPAPPGKGGSLVGGAALYISNKSDPAKQAAAWEYAKFLDQPENQAEWAAGTGYIPIRQSAVDLPAVKDLWARQPGYKVAYDQITSGKNDIATAGPVIGDYQGVRDAVLKAEQSMLNGDTKPKTAIKQAASGANATIQEYNSRVGA